MKKEILKFHYEEIIYALIILATDLKKYPEEDLIGFAEAIHRLDTLSEPDFLNSLKTINSNLTNDLIQKIVDMQNKISQLYSGHWHKMLINDNDTLDWCYDLSNQLLKDLHQEYIEPVKYAETNMDVNW